ncbi:MAG: hypothetical protein RML40_00025 [Bacteroidota bacterium]|nr:hypothetical protein [Candidatus Kapabacteria bacterium]MDW8218893.1 hypothetical protein [Bacteroidota bacterium]
MNMLSEDVGLEYMEKETIGHGRRHNATSEDEVISPEASARAAAEESLSEGIQMDETKRQMLQAFGEAYRGFGLSKQMGHIVALLLYSPQPLSLDDITEQLGMSKGPISQVTRRLNERNIIRKVWNPGSRKDYYEIQPEVFANAFRNFAQLIHHNTEIARDLRAKVSEAAEHTIPDKSLLLKRLKEMQTFYTLMEQHFARFLEEWATIRPTLYSETANVPSVQEHGISRPAGENGHVFDS